jgi:hypothetical protein
MKHDISKYCRVIGVNVYEKGSLGIVTCDWVNHIKDVGDEI